MNSQKVNLICLTPVKNEGWILDRFLQTTSLWADYIIIADQNSTDNSKEIAVKYSKVILITNESEVFNEPERQKLLIDKAREIKGKRIIIALDADEILSANFMASPEWETIRNAPSGTILQFQWVNILPDMRGCWLVSDKNLGYIDDGYEHKGTEIHSPRIPLNPNASILKLNSIKILHYQYTDWKRMESKHRWYQSWERSNNPLKSSIDIYRQYHHMYSISKNEIFPINTEWIKNYEDHGIDMQSTLTLNIYWWDIEVLKLLLENGSKEFRKEDIWSIDWKDLYERYFLYNLQEKEINLIDKDFLNDPRNKFEKLVHIWLKKSQNNNNKKISIKKVIEKVLKVFFGW